MFEPTTLPTARSEWPRHAAPWASVQLDLVVMVALTAFGAVAMRGDRVIGRLEGGLFLGAYVAFLVALGFT